MNQNPKKGKVKGSVLLTVVGVMLVMVVFLMSTLILTTAAQRRSYYTYFETQAQFAAQAALEAVTKDAYSQESFFNYISADGDTITVDFTDTDIPVAENDSGQKLVNCTIEPVSDNFIWDEKNNKLVKQKAWKITAVAAVGSEHNRAEARISNFIYANVRETSSRPNTTSWLTVSSFGTTTNTTPPTPGTTITGPLAGMTEAGLVTLGGGSTDNGSGGGSGTIGITEFPLGRTQYGQDQWGNVTTKFTLGNDGEQAGNLVSTGGTFLTGNSQYFAIEAQHGVTIMGNMNVQNGIGAYSITADNPALMYKELPYVYVDGTLAGQNIAIGYTGNGNNPGTPKAGTQNATPTNLYAGAIYNRNNSFAAYGDIFLYDPALTSHIEYKSDTALAQFIETNVTKSNYGGGYVGGDFISNNGTVELRAANQIKFGGDFIMTNPAGVLKFNDGQSTNNTVHIYGALVLAGRVEGNVNIEATGGVYVLPGSTFSNGTIVVNGHTVGDGSGWKVDELAAACADAKEKKADGTDVANSATSAFIESLGITVTGADYNATCTAIKNARKGYTWADAGSPGGTHTYEGSTNYDYNYDYSLFPFCSRLDEIFYRYVRWDTRDTDGKPGFATASGADAFSDYLVKESKAAGHTWTSIARTSTEYGTRYFPCTTPVDPGNNAFIGELETQDANVAAGDPSVIDSYAKLKQKYNSGNDLPYYDGMLSFRAYDWRVGGEVDMYCLDPAKRQNVTVYGHDADGVEKTEPLANAFVVNSSCRINLEDFNGGYNNNQGAGYSGEPIFIDPTVGNHTASNPLVVAFYGNTSKNPVIVFNNSAESTTGYQSPSAYADTTAAHQRAHASRQDVVIYFMGPSADGINAQTGEAYDSWDISKLKMYSSGAYNQINTKNADFVQNVLYPCDAGWDTLPAKDKYKFEMIPNNLICMLKGSMGFSNDGWLCGAVVTPTTELNLAATTFEPVTLNYRESYSSSPQPFTRNFKFIGSIYAASCSLPNLPLTVFAGQIGEPTQSTTPPGDPETQYHYEANQWKDASNMLDPEGGYFSNDHMGAG